MKHIYTLFILFVWSPSVIFSQNDFQRQKDSLLHVITNSKDSIKLNALDNLNELLYYYELNKDTLIKYSTIFQKEAKKQNRIDLEVFEKRSLMINLRSKDYFEEVIKFADDYLSAIMKQKDWKSYSDAYGAMVWSLYFTGQTQSAMVKANEFYEQSKNNDTPYLKVYALYILSELYSQTYRYTESYEFIKKALEEVKKFKDMDVLKLQLYSAYVWGCANTGKYDEGEAFLEKWEAELNSDQRYKKIPSAYTSLYRVALYLYGQTEQYDKVEKYCNLLEAQGINKKETLYLLYRGRWDVAFARKDYPKAMMYVEKLEENSRESSISTVYDILDLRVRTLCFLDGREEECLEGIDRLSVLSDSMYNIEMNSEVEKLRAQYEVDKHIAEKEKVRNYMYFAIAGCILLAIILAIWIYYNRQIAKKNKTLVNQIRELQAQQEQYYTELLHKTTFDIENNTDDDLFPENRKDKLCLAIRDIILKEKSYRDPSITRDSLVERLGTNKDLFIDAFQYCFGMSFPEYINSLRLKDSITLLEQTDLSIEDVSEKVGFGSVRTFQRQFQSRYNMSPKDYRKAAIK